jgi:hypothetical protein
MGITSINKAPGDECPNCSATAPHCTIYRNRPRDCQDFECGYRVSKLPVMFRPDHLHVIITGEDAELRFHVLHVDPKYPNALETPNGRLLLQTLKIQGKYPSILVVTGDKERIIDDNPVRRLRLEQQMRAKAIRLGRLK